MLTLPKGFHFSTHTTKSFVNKIESSASIKMSSSTKSITRQLIVPAEIFNKIYDHDNNVLIGSRSDWRDFYSQVEGYNLVTRSSRKNKKTFNIYAKHSKSVLDNWCPANYIFNLKMPEDRHAAQFTFKLKIEDSNKCDCAKKGKSKIISLVEVDVVPVADSDSIDCDNSETIHDPLALDVKPVLFPCKY